MTTMSRVAGSRALTVIIAVLVLAPFIALSAFDSRVGLHLDAIALRPIVTPALTVTLIVRVCICFGAFYRYASIPPAERGGNETLLLVAAILGIVVSCCDGTAAFFFGMEKGPA